MKTLVWCGRLVLGGMVLYAGVTKALDPRAFAVDIGHYRLLPHPLVLAGSVYLPWLEILCSAAVLTRWRERGALLILASLCTLFSAALASAWIRQLDITCGCFGHAMTTTVPIAFARSLVLGMIAFLLLRAVRPIRLPKT